MKVLVSILAVGAMLSLAACAKTEVEADYSYESQAPYSTERTVGNTSSQSAERMFESRQRK